MTTSLAMPCEQLVYTAGLTNKLFDYGFMEKSSVLSFREALKQSLVIKTYYSEEFLYFEHCPGTCLSAILS